MNNHEDQENNEFRSERPTRDDPFSPDAVDEQIDQLLALPTQSSDAPAQARFIHDLSALASEQTAIRDRVLQRLMARAASVEQAPRTVTTERKQKTSGERTQVMAQDGLYPQRTGRQRMAMVAAVIVVAAVVGSMVLLLSLAGRHGTQTAGQAVATVTPTPSSQSYCNKQDMGWYAVCSTKQDKVLNITKTINGNTFILHAVYTDNNRVILAYTQKYPANASAPFQPNLTNMTLTMQQGINLPGVGSSGSFNMKAKVVNNLYYFDTSAVPSGTHTLNLHLQITLRAITGTGPLKTVGTTSTDFSVPFHAGRVASLNQTVTVKGIAITLQKVIVSPTQTRLFVLSNRLQLPGDPQNSPYSLSVDNWSTAKYGFSGGEKVIQGKNYLVLGVILTENTSLINEQGQWTFKITSGAITEGSGNGMWIFHFTVPA